MIIETLLIFGALWLWLYFHLTRTHSYWKKLGIAQDNPTMLFGSVGDSIFMKRHRDEIIDELYEKFSDEKVVGCYNLRQPALIIRDPDIVHKILVTDFHSFRNNDVDALDDGDFLTSKSIFVLKDEEWRRNRALVTPAFTSGKLKAIYPQMTLVAKELVEYLKQHPEELHVKHTMSRYTTEVTAKCAFGIEGNSFNDSKSRMHELGKLMFSPSSRNSLILMSVFFIPLLNKIFDLSFIPKEIPEFFKSILHDVIIYRQKNDIERNDLVQYLIELKRKSEEVEKGNIKSEIITKTYTDEDVLAGCIMFFIEAYETTALYLTHVLYMLAMHKDIQDKLRQEIDAEMKNGEISFEALHELNYLNSVMQETNRIIPVTHCLNKRCTERYEMDLGNKSLIIEKGTPIRIPIYGLQNDTKYWKDPETFKPERFDSKEEMSNARSKGIYLPFGDGPRICIGVRASSTMAKLALAHIISKLEVLPSSQTPKKISFDPAYLMMTHKGGIHLRFAERSQ